MAVCLHFAVLKDSSLTESISHSNMGQDRSYHQRDTNAEVEGDKHLRASEQENAFSSCNPSSESGAEADNERGRCLKGLPVPPLRPRKGLRETPFEDSTPQSSSLDTPPAAANNHRRFHSPLK